MKVLGCTCALGFVMLCVHSWKIQMEKIKMPSLSVYTVVAANSVGRPQLALNLRAVSCVDPVAQSSETSKSRSVYLGQSVLEGFACCSFLLRSWLVWT